MWFKRDWELIDKEVQESGLEHMRRMGWTPSHIFPSTLKQTVVLTFKCRLTGKVKVVRE